MVLTVTEALSSTSDQRRQWVWLMALSLATAGLTVMATSLASSRAESATPVAVAPPQATGSEIAASESGRTEEVSMAEMLQLANTALAETNAHLDDYTARLIKQEQDRSGVLQPASEISLKVVTRHAGGTPGGPLKVYLRFESPSNIRGREVIWVEDQNDGKMQVREAGMVGAMMTVSLPPEGFLAMQGQRYPIAEIGLTRLLEKLIERGGEDRDDPHVRVFKTEGYPFDGRSLTHLRIERSQPTGRENDFAVAELVLDQPQNVVVSYRSFDWPKPNSDQRPLIESYEYHDLQTNVGLTARDFDTANPEYSFAK
ncbi:DUF1571 domain-containing protein [Allorhodopirellula heiligendammensis]|uniref:Uncharacterized protein n=1 Tax=Allorhodopirellula heiligendammensis TaxID=2714739 RepID=A0A5C6C634_9BACT|nr:DUF1571 domain-containing protein [Allorhodopirellula heiligendammensis]TWU18971.1 hypothetical protein Poly21_11420 [Allorhodopirellula heiligendammensis]